MKANKFTSATVSKKSIETKCQNKRKIKSNHHVKEQKKKKKKCNEVEGRSDNICTLSDYIQKGREHERKDGLPPVV